MIGLRMRALTHSLIHLSFAPRTCRASASSIRAESCVKSCTVSVVVVSACARVLVSVSTIVPIALICMPVLPTCTPALPIGVCDGRVGEEAAVIVAVPVGTVAVLVATAGAAGSYS